MEHMNFEEYRDDWKLKRPASIPQISQEESPYPRWGRIAALIAFVAAALLSGVHMMPAVYDAIPQSALIDEIQRQWVARGSFIAYELGMFMSAFLMGVQATRSLARILSTIIFLTLIAVNLYSVVQVYGFDLKHNLAGAAVSTMFSLVPAIAYASGKFYINIGIAERALEKRKNEDLRLANVELDKIILKDFAKYEKQFEISRNISRNANENDISPTVSRNAVKPRVKIHEIARQVHENGDDDLSTQDMMTKYNVSLGSTSKIREMLKGQSGNGLVQ